MPRNKVLEKAKVSMPSGRNAFDLSQVRSFTSRAGLIDICYAQPFVAGTKGKISRDCFTRTAQVVSPAFHDVTEHYDFFIVPIHSLWRQWENWKLNINDLQDTFSVPFNASSGPVGRPDLLLPDNAPRMDFSDLVVRLGYTDNNFNVYTPNQKCQRANNLLRLCDQLRYSDTVVPQDEYWPAVMNLFSIAAYQKCYFDHYRRTDYESNNPYAYNLDWLYDGSHNGLLNPSPSNYTSKDQYVARELFTMRSVNYRNDAFMNIYPALSYVQSVPSGSSWLVPSTIGGVGSGSNIGKPGVSVNGNAYISSGSNNMHQFTVQGIRAMFALDKLMRASAYAPKHVRDQYKALYGVEGVEDFDMRSERIGSFQSTVNFTEVLNMAQSENFNLGDLGARGIGGDKTKKFFNFYCQYDSIVIGLHYFLPRARYDAFGIHPWNTKIAREDFYIKAFENLGLRPFYAYNLKWSPDAVSSAIVGWTVPNHEYKILPDLNFAEFKQFFSYFKTNGTSVIYQGNDSSVLSTFVPHSGQALLNTIDGVSYESFKVLPQDLDNIFVNQMPFTAEWGLFQFFGQCRINVLVVSPMSVHGQPVL